MEKSVAQGCCLLIEFSQVTDNKQVCFVNEAKQPITCPWDTLLVLSRHPRCALSLSLSVLGKLSALPRCIACPVLGDAFLARNEPTKHGLFRRTGIPAERHFYRAIAHGSRARGRSSLWLSSRKATDTPHESVARRATCELIDWKGSTRTRYWLVLMGVGATAEASKQTEIWEISVKLIPHWWTEIQKKQQK